MAEPRAAAQVEETIERQPRAAFHEGHARGAPLRVLDAHRRQCLEQVGVEYGAIDVLPILQPLREVTAELSDWETFPQLYVKGELVGGCDIVEEMLDSGELAELLGVEQPARRPSPAGPPRRGRAAAPARRCRSRPS